MSRKTYDKKLVGLDVKTYPKNKRWQVDQDYIAILREQAKSDIQYLAHEAQVALEFMSKFNTEYVGGNVKKNDPDSLHNTEKLRKDCYSRNNSSNRDAYAIRECTGRLSSIYEKVGTDFIDSLANNPINDYEIFDAEENQVTLIDYRMELERKAKRSKKS
jgi:hypothetical protein